MLRFSYKYKPPHIALKCQGLKLVCIEASCYSSLMLHNKWPKVNRIEPPCILLTDSGSAFHTGHSTDSLPQFHEVWDPNVRPGRLWGLKSPAALFIHLWSLIGSGLNSPIGPLHVVSAHRLIWASSDRGEQNPRVSVSKRKLGVSLIFSVT